MSRDPLADLVPRIETLAANARREGKEEDAKLFEEGAVAIETIASRGRPSQGKRILRMLASRWVGVFLALAGIGLTGLAIFCYWPEVTASTPKTSVLVSLFVGEEIPSKFAGKWPLLALLAAWAIIPSGWLLLEWAYASPHAVPVPGDDAALKVRNQEIEEFKYMQSLSRAIWVAVLAVLAVLFGVSVTGAP